MKKILVTLTFAFPVEPYAEGNITHIESSRKAIEICSHQSDGAGPLKGTNQALQAIILGSPKSDVEEVFHSLADAFDKKPSRIMADCMLFIANESQKGNKKFTRIRSIAIPNLLQSGQFEKAKELADKWKPNNNRNWILFKPSASQNPDIASYFSLSSDGATAYQEFINLNIGTHVVVYFTPGCSFCERAKKEINSDRRISAVFRSHSLWIDSPDIDISRKTYLEWMNTESSTPGRFIIDRTHWPERDILAVPYFFFIKDGVIVSSHLGWRDGSKQKISQSLQEIGLLPTPTQ